MGDTYVAVVCIVYRVKKGGDESLAQSGSFTFPNRHESLVRSAIGYPVLYYRARATRQGGLYFAAAVVSGVRSHPMRDGKMIADVSEYSKLARPVSLWEGGKLHERVFNESLHKSFAIRCVREIPQAEVDAIIEDGELPSDDNENGKSDSPENTSSDVMNGLGEMEQASFASGPGFRQYEYRFRLCRLPLRMAALRIFDGTCIFTSIRQPFSSWRFEAECCHIRPLELGGPDVIQNVVLMTGTFHRLFDEGLISLEDDFRILVKDTVHPSLRRHLNKSGYATVPDGPFFRSALPFIRYHRRFVYGAPS